MGVRGDDAAEHGHGVGADMESPQDWAAALGVVALLFLGIAFFWGDLERMYNDWTERKDTDDE